MGTAHVDLINQRCRHAKINHVNSRRNNGQALGPGFSSRSLAAEQHPFGQLHSATGPFCFWPILFPIIRSHVWLCKTKIFWCWACIRSEFRVVEGGV